jgi:hypothetical protein
VRNGIRSVSGDAGTIAGLIEYGVVEKYSGYSSIGDGYRIDIGNDAADMNPATFSKLQIRLLKRAQDVYTQIGLRNVRQVIDQINDVVGASPMGPPTLTLDGSTVDLSRWSLRQVIALSRLSALSSGYSLRALANFMVHTQPFDTPYTNVPPGTEISLNQLLENFSD